MKKKNLILKQDVLQALGIDFESDLFPAPSAFPIPTLQVDRILTEKFIKQLDNSDLWILVGDAGVGKDRICSQIRENIRKK